MISTKRLCYLACSFFLAVSVFGNSALSVSAASESIWNTSKVATSVVLKKTLTAKQKKQLASYQKKDKAVGKAVSAADRKKAVKTLKSVTKYVFNFDYSLYQTKSQKRDWKKQIKKVLPSYSSKQVSSLWNTRAAEKQIKSSAPLTANQFITYKKGNKKQIIVYWAVNYAKPKAADASSYSVLRTVLKKTKSGYAVVSIKEKYTKPISTSSSDSSSESGDNSSTSTSGSGILGGGSSGNNSSAPSNDSTPGTVEGNDNVIDIGDLGWDNLFS